MAQKEILISRHKKLISWLKEHQIEGCVIQDPINLLYFTGIKISTGVLYIGVKKQVLIVDLRYYDRCSKVVPILVESTTNFKESLKNFEFPVKIAMDSHCTMLKDFELFQQYVEVVSYPNFLAKMRMIKDYEEIKKIKRSCQITKRGFEYIQKQFKEGITELELTQKLELFLRKEGAEKMAFDPIVAFGENAANPHYTPQKKKLKKNDLILIDCGSVYENYHSDMTRTFVKGKISERMEELIDYTAKAQKAAIKMCQPRVRVKDLVECVKTLFRQWGVQELFIHGLGHGVGLEIHELPSLGSEEMVLEPGMVITIEPGLYVPSLGGVRIEDTLLITETGHQNLTK